MNDKLARVKDVLDKYQPTSDRHVPYGTAGFRQHADRLNHIMPRVALISCLLSLKRGKRPVGLMITASHNPEEDNGIKIVDSDGTMAGMEIQCDADAFCNALNVIDLLKSRWSQSGSEQPVVILGRDTRPSSKRFHTSIVETINAFGGLIHDLGEVSTPLVHFVVWRANRELQNNKPIVLCGVEGYVEYFSERALAICPKGSDGFESLAVDCANAIGFDMLNYFQPLFKLWGVQIKLLNGPSNGAVNDSCGSDYIQLKQVFPETMKDLDVACASFDGDADRILFYYRGAGGRFMLVDGDKIAYCYVSVISNYVKALCSKVKKKEPGMPILKVSVVQTAYANGASTAAFRAVAAEEGLINGHGVEGDPVAEFSVEVSKTGVSNLHKKAAEADISVYFESNGHGTVTGDIPRIVQWAESRGVADEKEFHDLLKFYSIFNESVGDAITDLLAMMVSLKIIGKSLREFDTCYANVPYLTVKLRTERDHLNQLKPVQPAENFLLEPEELQHEVDRLVGQTPQGRAFIRASGTEDVARIYVEARTEEDCKTLSDGISDSLKSWFEMK